MLIKSLIILMVIFILIGVISFLLAAYNFMHSFYGIKGNRQTTASLLGPFSFIFASNFDEQGNKHRNKFVQYLIFTLFSAIIVAGLKFTVDYLHTY